MNNEIYILIIAITYAILLFILNLRKEECNKDYQKESIALLLIKCFKAVQRFIKVRSDKEREPFIRLPKGGEHLKMAIPVKPPEKKSLISL